MNTDFVGVGENNVLAFLLVTFSVRIGKLVKPSRNFLKLFDAVWFLFGFVFLVLMNKLLTFGQCTKKIQAYRILGKSNSCDPHMNRAFVSVQIPRLW